MIGKDIYTIDNLLSTYKQNELEDLFISNKLPWMFFKDCVTSDDDIKKSYKKLILLLVKYDVICGKYLLTSVFLNIISYDFLYFNCKISLSFII